MDIIVEYTKHYYHKIRYRHSPSRRLMFTDLEKRKLRESIEKRLEESAKMDKVNYRKIFENED